MKTKLILLASFFITVVAVILIIIVANVPKTITVTTFPRAYNSVSTYESGDSMEIGIYVSLDTSYFTEKENIESCFIEERNGEEELQVEVTEIEKTETKAKFEKTTFTLFMFHVFLSFYSQSDFDLEIEDAVFTINYRQGETAKLSIGSFSFHKTKAFHGEELSVYRLKGIVNEVNGAKTLTGILIGVENNSDETLVLNRFSLLDASSGFAGNEITVLANQEYESNTPMKEILGYDYIYEGNKSETVSLSVDAHKKVLYLLPIKYENFYPLSKAGFVISYQKGDTSKTLWYDDFTFFTSVEYSPSQISSLRFYTYENH